MMLKSSGEDCHRKEAPQQPLRPLQPGKETGELANDSSGSREIVTSTEDGEN
jgi:hypothetical protein